jgi:AmiR/NasT family two-component response regulator
MSAGNVLIVCGNSEVASSMENALIKEGYHPVYCAHSANEARRQFFLMQPDLIIVSTPLPDEQGIDFVYDAHERTSAGIIVMARPEQVSYMQDALEATGAMILPKPLNRLTLIQSARFALSVRNSLYQLKSERDNLKRRMDERKTIEQAKWLLVDRLKMSEAEAFRYIQKKAMDLRLKQIEIAEEVIREYN